MYTKCLCVYTHTFQSNVEWQKTVGCLGPEAKGKMACKEARGIFFLIKYFYIILIVLVVSMSYTFKVYVVPTHELHV